MATRTVLSREAAKNLREANYNDAQLQGLILELAEVHAKQEKNFKWAAIFYFVVLAAVAIFSLSRPGIDQMSMYASIGVLPIVYVITLVYLRWRVTNALKRGFLRNLRKGYPDQYEQYADLFQTYVDEAKLN